MCCPLVLEFYVGIGGFVIALSQMSQISIIIFFGMRNDNNSQAKGF